MENEGTTLADRELCDRILRGTAARAELEMRFRQPLERYLVGMCDRGDGRSQEKAVEIAGQILADCYTKSPSLLERWQGQDNLEAFLRTSGRNLLKSWWVSAEKKRVEVNSGSLSIAHAAVAAADQDPEELAMSMAALRAGVAAAARECPEGLVFMRLKGLHGVPQRAISTCWDHHEAQTSRRIREAMAAIRAHACETAEKKGFELRIEALQHALQQDPEILLGSPGDGGQGTATDSLRLLAKGRTDEATRGEWVKAMCMDSQLLETFARLLNAQGTDSATVVRDPALAGARARLTECLRRSLETLEPVEAAGLVTPVMSGCFKDLLEHAGAEGGTLWLLCPGEAVLQAVFNPMEPELAGRRQPLVSGIVSLVLATGEPACVSEAASHQRHSPAIDIALGKTTRAMIAVPFVAEGAVRGVLTAVRLSKNQPFGDSEFQTIRRSAEILASHLIENLAVRILE